MPKQTLTNAVLRATQEPKVDFMESLLEAARVVEDGLQRAKASGLPNFLIPRGVRRPLLVECDFCAIEGSVANALMADKESYEKVSITDYAMKLDKGLGLKVVDDFITFDDRPHLAESDDPDAIKDSIVAVLEDDLKRDDVRVREVLSRYNIHVYESTIDTVNQILLVKAKADRPYDQVNVIMSNMKVRKSMRGQVKVRVEVSPEAMKSVDDGRPLEGVYREFVYENEKLLSSEPEHWSRGTHYNVGEMIRLPGTNSHWRNTSRVYPAATKAMDEFWKRGTITGRIAPA